MRTSYLVRTAFALAAISVGGCNGVFGWESASLDPTLNADAGESANDAAVSTVDAASDDGAVVVGTISCTNYCTLIQANCTMANEEYGSMDVCMSMCMELEPGFAGETDTNTLACRQYHAAAAASNPDYHCHHAGPLGGTVCGSNICESFCLLDEALCELQVPPPYSSESARRTECAAFAYDTTAGDLQLQSGNTLNCRLYHLENAYSISASVHCPHTATVSAVCN